MKTLIGVASKHGSTRRIAEVIGSVLEQQGVAVDVRDIDTVSGLAGYDSVVLGSAIYMGKWQPAAKQFIKAHKDRLHELPVWVFSSGPVGTGEATLPTDLPQVKRLSGAIEHRLFGGRLEKSLLGRTERLIAAAVHAEEADSRDWKAIEAWAAYLAAAIEARRWHKVF